MDFEFKCCDTDTDTGLFAIVNELLLAMEEEVGDEIAIDDDDVDADILETIFG